MVVLLPNENDRNLVLGLSRLDTGQGVRRLRKQKHFVHDGRITPASSSVAWVIVDLCQTIWAIADLSRKKRWIWINSIDGGFEAAGERVR